MARTILVVDDNDALRGVLAAVLTHRGYNVLMASSGAEALEIAASGTPDGVITDLDMPGMDGIELCRRLKELLRNIPVWIMTGALRPGVARKAFQAGAHHVLHKPLNMGKTCAHFEEEFDTRVEPPLQVNAQAASRDSARG
jgi:two-component system, response regulator, stage 0 sporulation protein F